MTIEEFIKVQLDNIEMSKTTDLARIEGFYQGVRATLTSIPAEIIARDKENFEKEEKEQKSEDKKKVK